MTSYDLLDANNLMTIARAAEIVFLNQQSQQIALVNDIYHTGDLVVLSNVTE